MKKILLFLTILSLPFLTFSQGQANNWYFGDQAGLTFNSGTPQPLFDGQLDTNEGCATISDEQGALLFYTDGRFVWNNNHNIMPNGSGLFGESTSSQSAIIVPNPNNLDLYYIFTVDGLFPGENNSADLRGLNYSTVDMTLNGGLGDIIPAEKNVPLLPTNSEKITAVRNADCNTFWVITHFDDTFYAYIVDAAGVNNAPVTSVLAPQVPTSGYRDNALGYLKASPDGTKLAIAHSTLNNNPASDPQSPGELWLYDFDTSTGNVSNGMQLNVNNNSPYGVEFSADSNVLYTTLAVYSGSNFDHGELYQYNLQAADISASLTVISNNDPSTGALQLGPDLRIYRPVFNSSFLDVINNPEIVGIGCNYSHQSISLGGRVGAFGLPPFVQSLFNDKIDIIQNGVSTTNIAMCDGDSYTLNADNIIGATYVWTRNGMPLPEIDFDLEVTQAGTYHVEIDPNDGSCPITGDAVVTVNPLPTANTTTIIQCDGAPTDGFSQFNLTEAIPNIIGGATDVTVSFFETLPDAQNNTNALDQANYTNTVANTQIIFARVEDTQTGCYQTAEVTLEVSFNVVNSTILDECSFDEFANFTLSNADAIILFGLPASYTVTYYRTEEDALLNNNPLPNNYTNELLLSQSIRAKVENGNGCFGISNVLLRVNPFPVLEEDEEVPYCLNTFPNTITLSSGLIGGDGTETINWSTLEMGQTIEVNTAGSYNVTVTNIDGCASTRTITVVAYDIATFQSIEITDFSENNTITINVNGLGSYEYALDDELGPYQDSNFFENVSAGFHTVYVRNKEGCGTVSEEIAVVGYPKFFTPNADGFNDTWQLVGVNEMINPNATIHIFDRYGKLIHQLTPSSSIGWDGTFNGKPLPSSDYWFQIQLLDGRIFKGHFALKR